MNFDQFFSNFTTPDSIALLILWVLAFLFGILLGSALRGSTIRRMRKELETKQNELATTQGEVTRLTDELHLREADLRKAQFEVEEQRSKAARVADEKTKLYNEIYTLTNEVENLRKQPVATTDDTVIMDLNATIERLNAELVALQTHNQALEAELAQLRDMPVVTATLEPESQAQPFDYLADFQSTQNALRARLEVMEEKLNRLVTENDQLRTEMQSFKTVETSPVQMERSLAMAAPMVEAEPVWNLGASEPPRQNIVPTDTIQRDDLTRIDGIGPFLEKQLNDVGIYTYEQIARWDGADIHQVTQQIRYFPGRIERENWVGQALNLAQQDNQVSNPNSYDTALNTNALYPADHTDLTVIEGIGPRIEALLREAGINTWDDLAEADLDQLSNLLDANNLQFHNPSTWTAQARLAAGGHWELLKEYQEQLKGGRDAS